MNGETTAMMAKQATVSAPNQNDRIEEILNGIENTLESMKAIVERTHTKMYGDYQWAPRPETDDTPEAGGRMGMFEIRLKNDLTQLQLVTEVMESLESKA